MDELEAKKIAIAFLCERIKIERCDELPNWPYGFKPSKEYLFRFQLFGDHRIGASEYIAVSKETRGARYLGFLGE